LPTQTASEGYNATSILIMRTPMFGWAAMDHPWHVFRKKRPLENQSPVRVVVFDKGGFSSNRSQNGGLLRPEGDSLIFADCAAKMGTVAVNGCLFEAIRSSPRRNRKCSDHDCLPHFSRFMCHLRFAVVRGSMC